MFAVKMRAAARQDLMAKRSVDKAALAMSREAVNAPLWKDALNDDRALPIDEAADRYAAW